MIPMIHSSDICFSCQTYDDLLHNFLKLLSISFKEFCSDSIFFGSVIVFQLFFIAFHISCRLCGSAGSLFCGSIFREEFHPSIEDLIVGKNVSVLALTYVGFRSFKNLSCIVDYLVEFSCF